MSEVGYTSAAEKVWGGHETLRQNTEGQLRQLLRYVESIAATERTRIDRVKQVIKHLLPEEKQTDTPLRDN